MSALMPLDVASLREACERALNSNQESPAYDGALSATLADILRKLPPRSKPSQDESGDLKHLHAEPLYEDAIKQALFDKAKTALHEQGYDFDDERSGTLCVRLPLAIVLWIPAYATYNLWPNNARRDWVGGNHADALAFLEDFKRHPENHLGPDELDDLCSDNGIPNPLSKPAATLVQAIREAAVNCGLHSEYEIVTVAKARELVTSMAAQVEPPSGLDRIAGRLRP